jgi:hypothetical protein
MTLKEDEIPLKVEFLFCFGKNTFCIYSVVKGLSQSCSNTYGQSHDGGRLLGRRT